MHELGLAVVPGWMAFIARNVAAVETAHYLVNARLSVHYLIYVTKFIESGVLEVR